MKRTVLALALAAAMPAVAQAQTNITLNGSIDVAIESLNDDANGGQSDVKVSNGVWAGSRLAVVGSEDLGGGLKGIFNIEHRFSPDTGTVTSGSTFWAGQAWVGLQGGFGTVRLGRQYTPLRRALEPGDTTGFSWYNNGDALAGITTRFNNDVSYQSPNLGGVTIHAAYAAGEDDSDDRLGDAVAIGGVGRYGPFQFGLGYQRIDAGDTGVDDTKQLGASVGAKFGAFGVGAEYAQNEVAGNKRKAVFLSGSMAVGQGTVYLTLTRDDQGTDLDDDGLGLTYSHGLSKRTYVYASLGYNRIEQPSGDDLKARAVALGVRHFF
jgi:predicted porin